MSEAKDDPGHGVESACYMRDAAGLHPILVCLCGFVAHGYDGTWAEAGAELDDHIEASEPTAKV